MGNEIFIQYKRVCVQPFRSSLEAIQKLQPPFMVKGCRSFVAMANFLKHVLPRITEIVKTYIQFDQKRETIYLGEKNKILLMKSNTD